MLHSFKRRVGVLLVSFACISISQQARAFAAVGHSAVGDVAAALIKGSRAETEVKRVLGPVSLHDIAVWSDCVKGIDAYNDFKYTVTGRYPECAPFENAAEELLMRDYVQRNNDACAPKPGEESCHKQYHYTNPAVQAGRYVAGAVGTGKNDIVMSLRAAIARLQGGSVPAPYSLTNEREALALLVHVVGDLHQPLHVGSIYLDAEGKVIVPQAESYDPLSHTVGGNAITMVGGNLHGYWDGAPNRLSEAELQALPEAARAVAPSAGAVNTWPQAWADDTIQQANQVFEGLSYGARQQSLRGPRWLTTLPPDYDARSLALTKAQLAKGGARLAQLLKALWP